MFFLFTSNINIILFVNFLAPPNTLAKMWQRTYSEKQWTWDGVKRTWRRVIQSIKNADSTRDKCLNYSVRSCDPDSSFCVRLFSTDSTRACKLCAKYVYYYYYYYYIIFIINFNMYFFFLLLII